MVMRGADVVTVPDFQGANPALFEARTLLFLGFWLENAGSSRDWPLHLACIGEPPESVRRLAERCEAIVSVHPPTADGKAPTRNKLRGFEVKPRTDRLLLLDVDVLLLGDPAPILELGECLAIAPAGNHRVPREMWQEIYQALGMPLPGERMLSIRAELADRLPERAWHGRRHLEPMIHYYNSGVFLVPWVHAPELLEHWEGYLDRLAQLFPLADPAHRKIAVEDQVSLALALERIKDMQLPLRRLPDPLHTTWMHLMAGAVTFEQARIYHAVHLLRLGSHRSTPDWLGEVDLYEDFILGHLYPPSLTGQALRGWHRLVGQPPGAAGIRELCSSIRELMARYVLPARPGQASAESSSPPLPQA
jgi:hypothetical protein